MRARGVILNMTGSPVASMDEDMMTLDTHGVVYQGQWAFSPDLGVLAYEQPADALTLTPNGRTDPALASTNNQFGVTASRAWTATTSDPWITVIAGATGGGSGVVKYALSTNANATSASRSGSITVTSLDGLAQTFNITQTGTAFAPSGEQLTNPSFDTAAGADWQIAGAASRATMFLTPGEADMHVSSFTGKLLWQDLNLLNIGGMSFRVGATLHSGFYPAGKSVAVYLDYLDGAGAPQRMLVIDPENRDIASAPSSSYFENLITMPANAQKITGFSVDRLGPGEFTAESFSLVAIGFTIPIASLAELQSIGVSAAYPLDGNYVLLNDIYAASTEFADNGNGFAPIGGLANNPFPFTGSFDGQNHLVIDLHINRATLDAIGLFRSVAGRGIIRNLGMKDGSISGQNDVGAIIGMSDNSTVLRC
jgi:hypothetical protein